MKSTPNPRAALWLCAALLPAASFAQAPAAAAAADSTLAPKAEVFNAADFQLDSASRTEPASAPTAYLQSDDWDRLEANLERAVENMVGALREASTRFDPEDRGLIIEHHDAIELGNGLLRTPLRVGYPRAEGHPGDKASASARASVAPAEPGAFPGIDPALLANDLALDYLRVEPFGPSGLHVEFSLPEAADCHVSIYAPDGRELSYQLIEHGGLPAGLNLDLGHLPPGDYLLLLGQQGSSAARHIRLR